MPRPGPRPYECVRRAWHSERHQPMRGLIIQQIFRLVHDNHCVGTKKNKEWLEKLPTVVFKAEEIMYSKANSEVEYSNHETLWDRVNEAIDTIIRKEESTETGELLPPCVEAALNLGCVPVRASRSQRNQNPRPYLRPVNQESTDLSPNVLSKNPQHLRIGTNKTHASSSCEILPCTTNNRSIEMGSVYPLYHGPNFNPQVPHLGFENSPKGSDAIIVGVPVYSSVAESSKVGFLPKLFPYAENRSGIVTKGTSQEDSYEKGPQMGCDLSLRLGPFSCPNRGKEKGFDFESGSEIQTKGKEFLFFPVRDSEVENQNTEVVSRKRKEHVNAEDSEYELRSWTQDSTSKNFYGQMKRPGL